MNIQTISTYFQKVKWTGKYKFQCCCPAHDDEHASLSVTAGKKGIILHCHAGCKTENILEKLNLSMKDLFYENNSIHKINGWKERLEQSQHAAIEAVYDYKDENGTYLYSKVRFKSNSKGNKHMMYGILKKDYFQYGLKQTHKTLYRLPELIQAIANKETIYFVEGEKDVETLRKRGLTATTAGGVNDWNRRFSKYFAGANVILLPDNDEPGRNLMENIYHDLSGLAQSVKIIIISQRNHGDITDYFDDGYTLNDFKQLEAKSLNAVNAFKTKEDTTTHRPIPQWLKEKLMTLKPERTYSRDDKGNGDLFADTFQEICRFNSTTKCWYSYNGKYWEEDKAELKVAELAKLLQDGLYHYSLFIEDYQIRDKYIKYVASMGQQRIRKNMILDARSKYPIQEKDFDKDIFLFNCQNGTYNFKTGKLQQHSPKDFISKISNAVYSPAADSKQFEKFILEVMQGDKQKVMFIQKILGMALAGITREEKLFIFYGATTRNGKSTGIETYLFMVGDYGATIQPESLAQRKKDSRNASGDIARLKGVRFVNAPEPPQNMYMDIGLVKQLTGNDTITARRMYQEEIEFQPHFIIIINTNFLPQVTDETLFSSERIIVIPFTRHFSPKEQDKELKSKLKQPENISGLLNWCIKGYQEYQRNGLSIPDSIKKEIQQYQNDNDKIGMYINEKLIPAKNEAVTIKQIYPDYEQWCSDNHYGCKSKIKFIDYFKRKNMLTSKTRINNKQCKNVIKGYTLLPF